MLIADSEIEGGERTKLLDFGIAKLTTPTSDAGKPLAAHDLRTRNGVVLGTPIYMSPEQCRGAQTLDGKSDVYSLGVLLYQMLAGQPPFLSSDGEMAVMAMHMVDPVPPLLGHAPGVTPQLTLIIERMLAKAPTARPTMTEVAAEFARLSEDGPLPEPSQTLLVSGSDLATSSPSNPTTLRAVSGQLAASRGKSRRSWLIVGGMSAVAAVGTLMLLLHGEPSSPSGAPARPAMARPLAADPKDPSGAAHSTTPPAHPANTPATATTPPAHLANTPATAVPAPGAIAPQNAPQPKSPATAPALIARQRPTAAPARHPISKTPKPGKRRPSQLVD